MYVNHSLYLTHSHIFPDGSILTHAHPYQDCKGKQNSKKNHPVSQIIVLNGLTLVLENNFHSGLSVAYKNDEFEYISFPEQQFEKAVFHFVKPGRAPPVFPS